MPQQGALLTNYYGTGHFSMDNYISLVSGQAPSYAVQDDCSTTANMTNNNSGIITNGTVGTVTDTDHTTDGSGTNTNAPNAVRRRPTATTASCSCTAALTPRSAATAASTRPDVATLFNQYNAAGVSWKAYAQDLGGAQPVGSTTYVTGSTPGVTDTVPGRDDGACGYPGSSTSDPVTNPTNLVSTPTGRHDSPASPAPSRPTPTTTATRPTSSWRSTSPFGWFTSLTR